MTPLFLASYVLLWLLVVALLVLSVGILRLLGERLQDGAHRPGVLVTDEGAALAAPAPSFGARTTADEAVNFPSFGRKSICLFLTPSCRPCQDLVAHLNRFWETERQRHEFFIVVAGRNEEVDAFRRLFRPAMPLIIDADGQISSAFGHERTPYAYLVDEAGITRIKGVVNDERTLQALLELRGQPADIAAWRIAPRQDVSTGEHRVLSGKEV